MTTEQREVAPEPEAISALRAHARALFVGPDAVYPEDLQRSVFNMVQRIILEEFVSERTRVCPSCNWPEVIRRLEALCQAEQAKQAKLDADPHAHPHESAHDLRGSLCHQG